MHWTICAKVGPKKEFIEWLGEEVFGDEAVKLMRMPYRAGPFLKIHENDHTPSRGSQVFANRRYTLFVGNPGIGGIEVEEQRRAHPGRNFEAARK